jgi:hypothetical protein
VRSVVVGVFVGVGAAAVSVVAVALPLFFLASALDPARGTGRSFINHGLLATVPVAVLVGGACGVWATMWHRRGGRLPREDDGYYRS